MSGSVVAAAHGSRRVTEDHEEGVALRATLDALYPGGANPEEYVVRLRGFEILDENASLVAAGIQDGSILLLVYRRRQPVR